MSKVKKDAVDEEFEKHMHDGHRSRVLKTVNAIGLEHLSTIQIVEYILFFIFPRGDVNPLAHRLLQRFETVSGILDASVEDLMRVKGMGESSAMKLHSLLTIFDVYLVDKLNSEEKLDTVGDLYNFAEILLRHKNEEICYLFGISPSGTLCHSRVFSRGDIEKVNFDVGEINTYVSTFKVKGLIFAHNHPRGTCQASKQDKATFAMLNGYLGYSGLLLYDSIIVGRDGIFSCRSDRMVKEFRTGDDIKLDLSGFPDTTIEE